MYEEAKRYYEQNGNLNAPAGYKPPTPTLSGIDFAHKGTNVCTERFQMIG